MIELGRRSICNVGNIVEPGIPMKLERIIKMFLNEKYSRVQVDKHLFGMCPLKNDLKQGDAY